MNHRIDGPSDGAGAHKDDWPTGFMLVQGNRLERLCTLMTTWMRRHPLRPLESEVVLVQSNGIGQWLKLALAADPRDEVSGGCGIAAAVDLSLPARFVWRAYQAVLGELPDRSVFDKAPLRWRLYRLLGNLDSLSRDLDNLGGFVPLRRWLETDVDARRRHQLSDRLADLFDQYQVYRADWLDAWQTGEDVLICPDGGRQSVPADQRWQPALWRLLKRDVAARDPEAMRAIDGAGDTGAASRADIHRQFLEQARSIPTGQGPADLPRRVIVFGISSLPRQTLDVLGGIAHLSQVMLFVHNPSRHYWGDIIEGRELFGRAYGRRAERRLPDGVDETQLHLHGHPLLAAWGKQGRDYIRLLDAHDQRERYEPRFRAEDLEIDLFDSPGDESLLQQLQDDILELRPMRERQALAAVIDPERDRSIGFCVAHSRQREIEILHDQLLDAFEQAAAAGRPLHPRDVLVMVPDIDRYAPHIDAVFGCFATDDSRHIPFHLSDQGRRHRNPLLIALEALLQLPRSRFAVSELLDLLDIPALRARLRVDEADLPRLRQWIHGANIRWGLDARQRAGLGLPGGLEQNTWAFGLRRMLLGFAAGTSGPWQGVEPYDEIGGLEAALIGPLERFLETLAGYWQAMQRERRADQWAELIAALLDDLFMPDGAADELAVGQVLQALEQWVHDCHRGGAEDLALPLEVVRESVLPALDEPPLNQRFLAGAVNFATLMPMRAVPFRQIWLLGMNDGDYPRGRHPEDFDLMANDYRPGDRSRREDDRYLFLEALLSARERLVVGWVGRNIRDNSVCPPSVLVGQLRDHISTGWKLPAAALQPMSGHAINPSGGQAADQLDVPEPARTLADALTTEHPLQPFSRRYFESDRDPRLFTYAGEWRSLHQGKGVRAERPPRLGRPVLDGPVDLRALGAFLRHPVRHFYTRRLAVSLGRKGGPDAETIDDEEVFRFDGLGNWAMRHAVVESVLNRLAQQPDVETETCVRDATARLAGAGSLPIPPFDRLWTEGLLEELAPAIDRYRALLRQYPLRCGVQLVHLERTGIRLADVLTDLREDAVGNRSRLVLQASRVGEGDELNWHHLVRPWPIHLAAQIGGATTTWILGPDAAVTLSPLDAEQAQALLGELMDGYLEGVSDLLPLACKTGFAALSAERGAGVDPGAVYEGGYNHSGELQEHPGYQRFWPSYAALREDRRFSGLVDRFYRPLVAHGTSGVAPGIAS